MADDDHYDVTVNRGEINMRSFADELNDRWKGGWQLDQAFEEHGNLVTVWARRSG